MCTQLDRSATSEYDEYWDESCDSLYEKREIVEESSVEDARLEMKKTLEQGW